MTHQLELTAIRRAWLDDATARFAGQRLPTIWLPTRFTTDDLHHVFPWPEHDNWWGVLTAHLKAAGLIRCVGYQPSARKERNGGVVRIWERV